ncbi:MAG: chain length determinant protein tyrosine kinase EpsG [Pseudomonadota bacterium]|jgi:receptor protein-tyrosine kinase
MAANSLRVAKNDIDMDSLVSPNTPGTPAASGHAVSRRAQERLGDILVALGALQLHDVQAVLAQQADNPRRFGELALSLGLVARTDIDLALARQIDVDFEPGQADSAEARALSIPLPPSEQGEVLRSVRSQLLLRWFGEEPEQHTLAVMSQGSGDGRSHVCAQLARLFAQSHEDTLVIDADFNHPRQHEIFGVSNKTGLSNYLSRDIARAPVRAVRGVPNLHVLPAGPSHPDGMALLERQPFARLLQLLSLRYSVILIDTPPAGRFSEAVTVAVRASGALIVTRRNRTRLPEVQRLVQTMTRYGVEVLGALVNEH